MLNQTETADNGAGPARDLPWLGALLALLAVQWAPFLFTNQSFYFRDLSFFFAPLLVEAGRQWGSGILPVWNPHLACGAPLAADPNAGVFFPDIFIVPLLGAGVFAVKALLLLRLVLVPLAAYAALRRLPLPPRAAWLGGAVVSLSGPLASSLSSFPPQLAGSILFIPLIVCGSRLSAVGIKPIATSAILLALIVFAGSPELALQSAIAFAACGLASPLSRSAPRVAFSILGGALLSIPQWLPSAALFPRTPRGLGQVLSTPPGFLSFPPVRLFELLWPGFLGNPGSPDPQAYWGRGPTDGVTPYLLSIAVGLLPLALLTAATRHPTGRRLAAVTAVFIALSFGRHLPAGEVLVRLPLVRMLRYPEKWWIGATLALAAIAAIGWHELDRRGFRQIRGSLLVLAIALGLSVLLTAEAWLAPTTLVEALRASGLPEPTFPRSQGDHVVRVLAREGLASSLAAVVFVLVFVVARRSPRRRLVATLLTAAVVAERLWRVVGATPAVPLESLAVETPGVTAARAASNGGRFFYDHEATTLLDRLRPFAGTIFGLSYAGNTDIDQFSDARSRNFADSLHALPFSDDRKTALLRLANVWGIDTDDPSASGRTDLAPIAVTESGHTVYRLSGAYPAHLFYKAVRAEGAGMAIRYLRARAFPTETVAVIEGQDGIASEPSSHRLSGLARPRPNAFRLRVETETPALLQISVTFDPNWRISIDGRPKETFPIDATFLGVRVPSGSHDVAGDYRDHLFVVGALVALLAVAGFGIWAWRTAPAAGTARPSDIPRDFRES
jgi:hypothetical protein